MQNCVTCTQFTSIWVILFLHLVKRWQYIWASQWGGGELALLFLSTSGWFGRDGREIEVLGGRELKERQKNKQGSWWQIWGSDHILYSKNRPQNSHTWTLLPSREKAGCPACISQQRECGVLTNTQLVTRIFSLNRKDGKSHEILRKRKRLNEFPKVSLKTDSRERSWTHASWITALRLNHKTLLPLVCFAPSRVSKKKTALPS